MNLLDFGIMGLLALFMLSGLHKGFMWTAVSVLGSLLAILLAFMITPFISAKVVSDEKVFNQMLYYTEGSEYIYDVEYGKAPISTLSNSTLEDIYNRSDVAYPMDKRIRENIENDAFSKDGINTLGDYFNYTMVHVTINILVFLLVYAVIRLLVMFGLGWWNYAHELPTLKRVDVPASIGAGLIRGIMALFILFMLCPIVLTVLPFEFVENTIENSVFASFFYYSNVLLSLISGS